MVFVLLVSAYIHFYAGDGLEANDTGFILGLAHQVYFGDRLYEHIIYVRPPVSPILHSLVFYPPFSIASVYFDRVLFFLQIATYSLVSAGLAKTLFSWTMPLTGLVACLIFVFSAHAFPPMAWHTVDGIFFSVIALYTLVIFAPSGIHYGLLSAIFAILAAASKQPFLTTPVILLILAFILTEHRWTGFFKYLACLVVSGLMFLAILPRFGSVRGFLDAMLSAGNRHEIWAAGVQNYLRDLWGLRVAVTAGPLLVALALGFTSRGASRPAAVAALASLWVFLAVVAQFYLKSNTWAQPFPLFDGVFVATFLYSFAMALKTPDPAWRVMVAMHVIAWSASISWGYESTILYAAPSIIALAVFIRPAWLRWPRLQGVAAALLPAGLMVFMISHRFYYSQEVPVPSSSMTSEMGDISPRLRFIRATAEQHILYGELVQLVNGLHGKPFVVLPNIPLAHTLSESRNPIGIDWPMNAELGIASDRVMERLNHAVEYAIVFRKAWPRPEETGKYGSKATLFVRENWKPVAMTDNFSVYENPLTTTAPAAGLGPPGPEP